MAVQKGATANFNSTPTEAIQGAFDTFQTALKLVEDTQSRGTALASSAVTLAEKSQQDGLQKAVTEWAPYIVAAVIAWRLLK